MLDDCHGNIVGRTAQARRFYNRLTPSQKNKVEGDLRETVWQMQHYPLIKTEAVLGMDLTLCSRQLLLRLKLMWLIFSSDLLNFAPFEQLQTQYEKSPLPIQDIIVVSFNEWTCDDPFYNNVGAHN